MNQFNNILLSALAPAALALQTVLGVSQANPQSNSATSVAQNDGVDMKLCCPVIELRQYTLYPGKRDVLIDLFDREFVEAQEAVRMKVIAQFRDLHRPDRFVWMRGFEDMDSRKDALSAFYGGPVWKAHRDEANSTMEDSSNVLLLRQVDAQSGFLFSKSNRPPVGASERPPSLVVATIYYLSAPVDDKFIRFFESKVKPTIGNTGAQTLAYFQSETAENTYPKLPIRTGENVFVWFARFVNVDEYQRHIHALQHSKEWQRVLPSLSEYMKSPPEQLELAPTSRSQLR